VNEVLERMKISTAKNISRSSSPGASSRGWPWPEQWSPIPKLILADEPTGNLDSANGEEVMNLLTELNKEGTTIVMVTHSPSDAEYAHRIIQLFDGHVVTENIKKIL